MSTRERMLTEALEWALQYIDAIPADAAAQFPAMPGFDRDYVDELVAKSKADLTNHSTAEQAARAYVDERITMANCGGAAGALPAGNYMNQSGNSAPMSREAEGQTLGLSAKLTYPGSRVSDLLIGGHKVQLPNEALRAATFAIFQPMGQK